MRTLKQKALALVIKRKPIMRNRELEGEIGDDCVDGSGTRQIGRAHV